MGFIDDQRVVAMQRGIALQLLQQDAVGHELDPGLRAGALIESDLVSDGPAHSRTELECQPRRQRARRDPSRLCVAYESGRTAASAAGFQAEFRQLRRFARTGGAADDDDWKASHGLEQLGPMGRNRQPGVVLESQLWWRRSTQITPRRI